jgi:hypothetical protein
LLEKATVLVAGATAAKVSDAVCAAFDLMPPSSHILHPGPLTQVKVLINSAPARKSTIC